MLLCAAAQDGAPHDIPTVKLPVVDQQDIRFKRLSTTDGLSQTRLTAMVEDDQGFIWLGTQYGLNRYDGYKFKLFKHEPGRPESLGGVVVQSLFKDRSAKLWIGTDQFLDRFDPDTETFTHYRLGDGDPKAAVGVLHISQDRDGMLWLATEGGLLRLDPATGTITRYRHDPGDPTTLSNNFVRRTAEDKAGRFWVATRSGLDRFDRTTGKVTLHVVLPEPTNSSFYEDSAGVFWITYSSGNGLAVYDRETNRLTRYLFHDQEPGSTARSGVLTITEDRAGTVWLGTVTEGLLRYDREHKSFIRYRNHPANPESLPHNQVHLLLADREGNIWAGIQKVGVAIFTTRKPSFERPWRESDKPGSPNSLVGTLVNAIHEDRDGILWLGCGGALIRLDRKTGFYTAYRKSGASPTMDVTALAEDSSGALWVGTYGDGLKRFDRQTGQFKPLRNSPADASVIFRLSRDQTGTLWVFTWNDVLRLDSANERLVGLPMDRAASPGSNSLSGIAPFSMAEDRRGGMWIGSRNAGLFHLDPHTGQFATYSSNPGDPRSLSNNRVNSPYVDRANRIWAATQNGLNEFDPKTGRFTTYYERDGLAGNVVSCILEDGRGDLWLGTNRGVSRFDPLRKTFKNYTVLDGLPGLDFSGFSSCLKSPGGEMFFAGFSGVTAFYPDRVVDSEAVPPVVLTDFRLFGQPVGAGNGSPLRKSINLSTEITLPYWQNSFSLEFSALSYLTAGATRYRYRLDSVDPQWNEAGSSERLVTYPATRPGDYTFRVQASSGRGGWNEPGTALVIHVLPPWWATLWFRGLLMLTIAGAMLAAYKARVRGLKLAALRLEAQVEARTHELAVAKEAAERANKAKSTFLATMSHELRTPLNAILGFSSLVRDSRNLPEEHREKLTIVNRSGEQLLGLIDDVLDTAKIEAGRTTLEKRSFDVVQLVRENIDMMRVRAADRGLELTLDCSAAAPRFIRSDAGKIRQMLINLMGNAVKFTERGGVTVRLDGKPIDEVHRTLILEVEDTGIGIALEDQARIFDVFAQAGITSNQKGAGLGLSITQQFTLLMGGAIHVESALGNGSRFRIELPVEVAAEPQDCMDGQQREVIGLAPGQPAYRILIVEDRKENWQLLQQLLLRAGFQVAVAEDGAQAVEKFRTWRPDLIWMDVRLPVMGGVDATRRIRQLDGGHAVKIVALSASAFAHERSEVLGAGMDDFLRKPYRREEIFEIMSRRLGVRYVYRETDQASASNAVPLVRPDLTGLPEELRQELADAVVRLDPRAIQEAIQRVAAQDARAGEFLSSVANRLAYSEILKALAAVPK